MRHGNHRAALRQVVNFSRSYSPQGLLRTKTLSVAQSKEHMHRSTSATASASIGLPSDRA